MSIEAFYGILATVIMAIVPTLLVFWAGRNAQKQQEARYVEKIAGMEEEIVALRRATNLTDPGDMKRCVVQALEILRENNSNEITHSNSLQTAQEALERVAYILDG